MQEFSEGGSGVGQRAICLGTSSPSPSFYALNFTNAEIKRGSGHPDPPCKSAPASKSSETTGSRGLCQRDRSLYIGLFWKMILTPHAYITLT